jgi:site-specific recombinase XerD
VCRHPRRPLQEDANTRDAYLDKPEVDALLRTPDRRTGQGARNHALLLFLYNTGARVDEAAHVTVADLIHGASPAVRLVARARRPESVRSGP